MSRSGIRSYFFVVLADDFLRACSPFKKKSHAQDYTWNVSGTGSWTTATNWLPVGVPGTSQRTPRPFPCGRHNWTANETIQSLTLGRNRLLSLVESRFQPPKRHSAELRAVNEQARLKFSGAMTTDSSTTTVSTPR